MTPAQLLYQKLELLLTTTPREIKLAAQEIWSGELVPGTQIICKQGIVWLTQFNDSQDHLLHHGQQFLITNPGKVVIQALVSAEIFGYNP